MKRKKAGMCLILFLMALTLTGCISVSEKKEKELDCLYALTDTIDCSSLADVCEESLAEIEDIMEVQSSNNNADISEVENEQEEIHVVKNINELAG